MDFESDANANSAAPAPISPPAEQLPAGIKIRTNYKPGAKSSEKPPIKCRMCGNMIASDYINKHLQIELFDPKYAELKEEYEARGLGKNLAQGHDIASNLERLSFRRPDIFGDTEVYAEKLRRENEQIAMERARAVIWDGQMKGMSRTSAK